MSKRKSIGAANTLFKYFTKSPPPTKKAKLDTGLASSDNSSFNGVNNDETICKSMQITLVFLY